MNNAYKFYILANSLKTKIRTGWVDVEISKNRIESVSEHIYGTLILAISLDSEYKLDVDMDKVLKMLTLHELEEIIIPDYTPRNNITREEKIKLGREAVLKVTDGLIKQEEIINLLDEFNERNTKEAKFSYLIDKLECDLQAKLYDLEGCFDINKAKEDYEKHGSKIDQEYSNASDYWFLYDILKYQDDDLFKKLINDLKSITKEDLDKINGGLYEK